ncbi:hypothetical protein ACQUFY_12025 [Robbsia andropogonis]|uniref:hypothetical protein n=1 Tax=Robbsia andropogonis TaxID=28092 RepID=UPI003D1A518D
MNDLTRAHAHLTADQRATAKAFSKLKGPMLQRALEQYGHSQGVDAALAVSLEARRVREAA